MNGTQLRTLVLVSLFSVMFMLHSEVGHTAEITILDNTVIVETDTYRVRFENGVINKVVNKITDEVYTLPPDAGGLPRGLGGLSGILRKDNSPIWTSEATLIEARKIAPIEAEVVFREGQNEFRLSIAVDEATNDLLIGQAGVSDTAGVYGVQWGCGNLDVKNLELILPALGGQVIGAEYPKVSSNFGYPGIWETQLAIIQGKHGGFFVRGTDPTFQFKQLRYERNLDSFALGFQTHNQAPFDTLKSAKSVTWRLNTYTGDWRVPAEQYGNWMEQTFDPWRLSEMHAWVGDIGLVVICDLDLEFLDRLAKLIDPAKTLLYVVGWREHAYDVNYPDYTAKEDFGSLVEAAHQHGFRVMPHTNLVGVSPYHPLYAKFQSSQLREPWGGNRVGWWWDRPEESVRHAFINLADSSFRRLLVQRLRDVWKKYGVDAFHLDISHVVVNDANGLIEGLNSAQGNVLLHKELAEAMPGVVFSGERLHEVTFFRESFAQRGKLSSESTAHPISAFLFSPYTQPYGHLSLPELDRNPQLYQEHLDSYENWGALPTLRLRLETLKPAYTGTQTVLSVARKWQQLGLKPDFEETWESGTLFQFVGRDGEVAKHVTTGAGSTFFLPSHEVGYERVFDVTQVNTERSLPHWRAYNQTTILGLNPTQSYFLNDVPWDFSQARINALPEEVSVTETRVTTNAAVFRLERLRGSYDIDLMSKMYSVRTGIVLNGKELTLQRGATFSSDEASVSGIRKAAIAAHPPYQGVNGNTFGEFTIALPESSNINLEFDIGLQWNPVNSDGVTFIVSVHGEEVFRQHHHEPRWEHIILNLTPYSGKDIVLRFTTNPGPAGNTGWDSAVWGEPEIVAEPVDTPIDVGFFLPAEPIKSLPSEVRSVGGGQYFLETRLPAQILLFFEPVQQVIPPYNLRNAEFVAGLEFDGIFRLGSAWNSGARAAATSSEVRKDTINVHPPRNGKTVLQFLLNLPQAQNVIFAFSMGLGDGSNLSDGVTFDVLLNGHSQSEQFINKTGWVDTQISLAEFPGETVLLELVTSPGESADYDWAHWADLLITAEGIENQSSEDINRDGIVNILDLVLVAQAIGGKPASNGRADVNNDGQVNVLDLVLVGGALGENAAAPNAFDIFESQVATPEEVVAVSNSLNALEGMPEKSPDVEIAIRLLRLWLTNLSQTVAETKLLPNFPNPFNPETWIPYQLAEGADVTLFIHDTGGRLVRTIPLGFKPAGYYLTRSEAAHWDGQNENWEQVSSGVYFLRFVAGEFSASRRVVVVK